MYATDNPISNSDNGIIDAGNYYPGIEGDAVVSGYNSELYTYQGYTSSLYKIDKASLSITIDDNQSNVYNGSSQRIVFTLYSSGKVVAYDYKNAQYKYENTGKDETLTTHPTNAGIYDVTVVIPESTNYYSVKGQNTFEITKATAKFTTNPTINAFHQGDTVTITGGVVKGINDTTITTYGTLTSNSASIIYNGTGKSASNTYTATVTITYTDYSGNYSNATTTVTATMYAAAYIGTTFYGTIELALSTAANGSDKLVYVATNTGKKAVPLHTSTSVESGVSLILPYDGTSYNGRKSGTSFTTGNSINNFADSSSINVSTYRNVEMLIHKNVKLTVNGSLYIGGIVGHESQYLNGQTSGKYAQITMDKDSKIFVYGTLEALGYIKEKDLNNGSIVEVISGTVKAPFVIHDYRGGSSTAGSYREGNISPFNVYDMPNVQSQLKIYSTGRLIGYADLYTGATDLVVTKVDAQHNTTDINMIGSSNSVINISDYALLKYTPYTFGYTEHTTSGGRTSIELYGGGYFGSMSLTVTLPILGTITVETSDILFPVSWKHDIILYDGDYTIDYKLKFLPGSSLTIDDSASLNLSGTLVVYDSSFSGGSNISAYPAKNDAYLCVNGSMIVTGYIGGKISTEIITTVDSVKEMNYIDLSNATSLSVATTEGDGDRDGLSFSYNELFSATFTANGSIDNANANFGTNMYMSNGNSSWTIATGWSRYTIVANANGGQYGSSTTKNFSFPIQDGDTKTITSLSISKPSKQHYDFAGWYLDSNCNTPISSGFTVQSNSSITIYANWSLTEYTITYNVVDDDGLPVTNYTNNSTKTYMIGNTLNIVQPTLDGYYFYGWYLDPTLETKLEVTSISASEFYSLTNGENQLYGYFTNEVEYTITFVDNNDDNPDFASINAKGGNPVDLSSYESILTAYDTQSLYQKYFAEWYYIINGVETKFVSNDTLLNGNITLYARWLTKECSITYIQGTDLNISLGLYTSKTSITYYYNKNSETILTLTPSTETGHTFVNWCDSTNSSLTYSVSEITSTTFSSNHVTLNANYTLNTYKITITGTANQEVTVRAGSNNLISSSKTPSYEGYVEYGTTINVSYGTATLSGFSRAQTTVTITSNGTSNSYQNGLFSSINESITVGITEIKITFAKS